MAENRRVAIIGAGIGGITAAVYMAKKNCSVDVFEKNSSPGGRCGQLIREGHRFDLGATMYMMPETYRLIFNSLGIKLEENNDIVRLENLYKIFFDDGKELAFTADKAKMRVQLERIAPGSSENAEKYVTKGHEIYQLAMDKLVGRNFFNIFQFTNFKNIGLLIKLKPIISNWTYAKRFFKHPHLLMAYTFQNIYVGQSPFNSPALFSMIPAAELTEGSFSPKGGMFGIIEKLYSVAVANGVRFHFNAPVSKIKIKNKIADCITLDDGTETKSDIIIANADLPYVYHKLLPDKRKSARIERMKYTCSVICFHWGLDKSYPQFDPHNVFLSDSLKDGLDKIFKDKTVDDFPTFYVHAPTRTDPGAAPPDQDTLSVAVGAGHIDASKDQDWDKLKQKTRDAVIRRLKRFGLEDIEDHIKFEICYTPEIWEDYCNISRGAVWGSLGHNIMQMGYFRPHNRHDRYHNLYFVGSSTHPGNGVPNVLMSAKLVTERIILEHELN